MHKELAKEWLAQLEQLKTLDHEQYEKSEEGMKKLVETNREHLAKLNKEGMLPEKVADLLLGQHRLEK